MPKRPLSNFESGMLNLPVLDTDAPTIGPIKKANGVAGQISYTATVTYPGEDPSTVTFVGSVYGPPIVMVTESGAQTFVTDPERFGTFGPEWVRRFFTNEN